MFSHPQWVKVVPESATTQGLSKKRLTFPRLCPRREPTELPDSSSLGVPFSSAIRPLPHIPCFKLVGHRAWEANPSGLGPLQHLANKQAQMS